MGQIRKQTIQLSFLTYVGFIIGGINTWLFARLFTAEQYGLTQVIISISQIVAPLAVMAMPSFIIRFFPYYFDHLENKKNDMLTLAVIVSMIGGVIVFSGCIIFEPLVVRKFSEKSALVVKYYYWSLIFSFFYLCFMVLEGYLYAIKKSVLPGFMKETAYRCVVIILIGLYAARLITFDLFVKIFCCVYFLIVAIILGYLLITKQLYLPLKFSRVTRRLKKQISMYVAFVYGAVVIHSIANQISTLALAGAKSLGDAGVFSLNQFSAAILQVPYRSLLNIATVLIARHWKDKNHAEIERIYKRSSINLLLISIFLFFILWLNYDDGLKLLGVYSKFAPGKTVFLILGIYNIMDLGTGVNASLLATSPAWKFEFYSGVFLLVLSIPLNIFMARRMGMEGVALATLITFTIYNGIRLVYIKRRFDMWPFSIRTFYSVVMAIAVYAAVYLLLKPIHGIGGILLRTGLFSGLFTAAAYYLRLTPDLPELLHVVMKKIRK